ncbi:MAG: class II glutamine amidotransferase domain-containing protein [Thermoplasmataceae archaeon]
MCRMFAMVGEFSQVFPEIFMSLQDVARNDPLLDAMGIDPPMHSDGWGYVSLSGGNLVHYRSAAPVYDSNPVSAHNGFILLHARKASPQEPHGVVNSHPFHASDQDMDIYLAHNGAFDKGGIAEILGIHDINGRTDSEIFLRLVISQTGRLTQRLESAVEIAADKKLLTGTPNLLVFVPGKETRDAEIAYYTAPPNSGVYVDYNRLYLVRGRDWSGVFSSSIIGSEFFPEDVEIDRVKTGRVFSLMEQANGQQDP